MATMRVKELTVPVMIRALKANDEFHCLRCGDEPHQFRAYIPPVAVLRRAGFRDGQQCVSILALCDRCAAMPDQPGWAEREADRRMVEDFSRIRES